MSSKEWFDYIRKDEEKEEDIPILDLQSTDKQRMAKSWMGFYVCALTKPATMKGCKPDTNAQLFTLLSIPFHCGCPSPDNTADCWISIMGNYDLI